MRSTITIGIAGGSGSGKTTLSKYLAHGLSDFKVKVIHMDKYYKKERPVTVADFSGRAYEDFNDPAAVDLNKVLEDLNDSLSSEDDVLIIEGFLLFHFPQLRECLDYKVFVDCQSDERLARRLGKFSNERYSMDEAIKEYLDVVRVSHDRYVEPTRWHADFIINGSLSTQKGSQMLLDWVSQKLRA
jgi:uridine kinase